MRAREGVIRSKLFGDQLDLLYPIIESGGSDSAAFDNVLELLVVNGVVTLPQAVMMLIPEAWQGNDLMEPEKKAFYNWAACLQEPWDGPALFTFSDNLHRTFHSPCSRSPAANRRGVWGLPCFKRKSHPAQFGYTYTGLRKEGSSGVHCRSKRHLRLCGSCKGGDGNLWFRGKSIGRTYYSYSASCVSAILWKSVSSRGR